MRILAIDPGKNTGLALFDTSNHERPVLNFHTTHSRESLWSYLQGLAVSDTNRIDAVVIEDYINRPKGSGGFDHSWDKGYTHRVIGAIEHWAWENRISEVVFNQPTDIKPTAGQLGVTLPKGHLPDWLSAVIHGYKFILARKLIPANKVLMSLQGGVVAHK